MCGTIAKVRGVSRGDGDTGNLVEGSYEEHRFGVGEMHVHRQVADGAWYVVVDGTCERAESSFRNGGVRVFWPARGWQSHHVKEGEHKYQVDGINCYKPVQDLGVHSKPGDSLRVVRDN